MALIPDPRTERATPRKRSRKAQPLIEEAPISSDAEAYEVLEEPAMVPSNYLDETEDEAEGRGLFFFFAATLLSVGVIVGGFFAIKTIANRGYLDQYTYVFQQMNLLPGRDVPTTSGEATLRVYLSDDGMSLSPHLKRLRRHSPNIEKNKLVLDALFSPDASVEKSENAKALFPQGTALLGAYVLGRVAYVDLSEHFINPAAPTARGERLAVYSIVNSLVLNNPDLDAVQILIAGKPLETVWGWLDASSPLGPDLSLIRS